ncbi:ankyrin repeat protein, putative [Trichomonas vaginalis G3]|uniref:Ankyrin repeat protein, putative n=1 Tax=Trichomonas vaginalis (strain ATCC PRA-98 / G3) TaxID=412133 RepID=A2F8R2_TRIV3|nr:spectrin binding [Trichomonas vaginalis G3]EAX98692.1 ankyrin repeat protein, putative [Trichomonas vaginalis G3]KAI5492989.1 spectrin binding [Trichomonas vaginalis G3]|eukprot:XP_001311622.1 ankyrin repeat protein [Trichomonas vaginalis G3]
MNDNTGKSPLILAIINNRVDVARNLLSRGANVNYVDRYGLSPIHYAIKASNYEMLELLVEYGANIN